MNLLILSYVYAPDRSPRAYRWTALAEHWAAEGHRVDIVSGWKQGDDRLERRRGVAIHRVGGGMIERLRSLLGQASHRVAEATPPSGPSRGMLRRAAKHLYSVSLKKLFWPDYAFHWYPPALARARALCRATSYDAVISVSHPFTPHLVGLALKRRNPGLRWLVDIGDPFSLLDEIPLNNAALYRGVNHRAEAAVLRAADAVAVTVERCRADLMAAFPGNPGKIAVVPPLLSLPARTKAGTRSLTERETRLVFVGTLYRALRDPSYLLALFQALHRRRQDLHLHFYGALNDCAPVFAAIDPALATHIHLHGMVAREEIAAAMRDADILVNIGNATPHQLPSKLVEYAAAARPILNLASATDDTAVAFLVAYPSALTILSRQPEPDRAALESALAFIEAPPPIEAAAIDRFLLPYTIERIAAGYADLLTSHVAA
jgi:glycosyltransferase involved in cell wall biosynthesis